MNEDLDAAEVVEPVTPTENDDTPIEEVKETPAEEAKAEPTEAEIAADKANKSAATASYQNRKLTRQLKSQQDNFDKQMSEMRGMIQKNSPQAIAPEIENFDSMGEFLDARDNFRDSQKSVKADQRNSETSQQDKDYQTHFNQSSQDLLESGSEKYDDFEQVVTDPRSPISVEMTEALFLMEDGIQSDVAYYLGKNPKATLRIAKLSPQRQFAELGRLEAKFADKPAAKRTSSAPKPISPVGGAKTKSDTIHDKQDFESFMKVRNKQLGR